MNALQWMTSSSALWYLNRATGLVALALLTGVVVLGVAATARRSPSWWPRFATVSFHRSVSLLAVTFLGAHIVTAVMDSYVTIRAIDVIVPFVGAYRPFWLGLGSIAFDLLAAVTITSLLRTRVPAWSWKSIHLLAYAAWPVAVVHGLGTGTDATKLPVLVFTFLLVAAVAMAGAWRVSVAAIPTAAKLVLVTTIAVLPIWLAGWVRVGPFHPGWSNQAQHFLAITQTLGRP